MFVWRLCIVLGVALLLFGAVKLGIHLSGADERHNKWVNDCIASGNVVVPTEHTTYCLPRENAPNYAPTD